MKREIKCRFWYKNEWHYKTMFDTIPPEWEAEIDYTLVYEYTGLKDRTGREIYEGDILKATYLGFHGNHGQTHDIKADGIVVFDYAQFKIDTQRKTKDGATIYKYFNQLWPDGMTKVDCEVIGNVYENPGLLKQ